MKKGLLGQTIMNWYRQLVRNSKYRWIVLLGTLAYLVSPIDISPDMFPVLGWIDDGLLATIAITEVSQILIDRKRNLRAARAATPATTAVEGDDAIEVEAFVVG
ncbi:MAG TPA: DUF1232 domain-containing protein [Leptolyngbyaceae cyanobacterium M65_K2018_010]|nr:DUF1232 domain-containing protein [Leptolyngbyaceae cyanobacterium M65_K2018_010]